MHAHNAKLFQIAQNKCHAVEQEHFKHSELLAIKNVVISNAFNRSFGRKRFSVLANKVSHSPNKLTHHGHLEKYALPSHARGKK